MTTRQTVIDRRLEVVIGYTLRIGVITAAIIVLIGGVLYLIENRSAATDYRTFHAVSKHSGSLSGIVWNIRTFDSRGVIQLGLLVLIATPIMRVVFSIIAFALERDIVYVIVTLIVLAVLLYSFLAKGA